MMKSVANKTVQIGPATPGVKAGRWMRDTGFGLRTVELGVWAGLRYLWTAPWLIAGLLTWGLVSGLEISGIANKSANRPGVAGSLILSAILASIVAVVLHVVIQAIREVRR